MQGTHSATNSVHENHLRAVNLTENYAKTLYKLLAIALRVDLQRLTVAYNNQCEY